MRYPLALDMSPYLESYVPPAGAARIAEQQLSNIVESLTAAASNAKDEEKKPEKEKEQEKGKQPAAKGKKGKKKRPDAAAESASTRASTNPDEKVPLEIGPIDQFGDSIYNLFSVVIHRGGNAGFGHYHAYIRDVAAQLEAEQNKNQKEEPNKDVEKEKADTNGSSETSKDTKEKEKVDEEKVIETSSSSL